MDVKNMNICLLANRVDRLERGDDTICGELLKKKYMRQQSIFQIARRGGSQIWRGLLEVKHCLSRFLWIVP
jgi:hypothetical protein